MWRRKFYVEFEVVTHEGIRTDEILGILVTTQRKVICLLGSYLKTQKLKYHAQKLCKSCAGVVLGTSY